MYYQQIYIRIHFKTNTANNQRIKYAAQEKQRRHIVSLTFS